ncbi:MAG: psd, partial [Betaproteobacteria bacterium]|nr:psd [Betaproteobacteria bacterium]
MSNYPHPIIAREGWPYLAGSIAVAIAVTVAAGWAWALFFWVIAVFILQFFRDPPRSIPAEARAVLAPADGRVVVVERTQ